MSRPGPAVALTDAELASAEAGYLAEARDAAHKTGIIGREVAAQLAGWYARRRGRALSDNPFPEGAGRPHLSERWREGWMIRDAGARRAARPKAPPPFRARHGTTHAAMTHPDD